MKYVSVEQMIAVEKEADASGHTYEMMMAHAGRGLAEAVLDEYGYLAEQGALGLVGSGNNGGDTLVALVHLLNEGWKASACILRPRPENDPLVKRLEQAGGAIHHLEQDANLDRLAELLADHALLLDGILGTGIRLPVRGELARLMAFVRDKLQEMDEAPIVVAVDCPSGVDCDSGEAAPECFPADLTVTMAAIKQGLLKFPAYNLIGVLRPVDIGLPEAGEALQAWRAIQTIVPDADWARQALPARPLDAHKGTFGVAMVVAGSANYTGAALLAGEAAYRIGAGLVTLAVPTPLHAALAGHLSEATWLLLPHEIGVIASSAADVLLDHLERVTALLLGPGFGLEDTTGEFLGRLLDDKSRPGGRRIGFMHGEASDAEKKRPALPPLVIDADGLKLLTRLGDWAAMLPKPTILTPHPGEMSALTGLPTTQIQADRLAVARQYSHQWGHVVVLKGAFSVVAAPDGRAAVIPVATPALARAGSGDVLAGLIVGLRAQGVEAFPAAVAGAWIHAYAGLEAAHRLGNSASVLAGDILRSTIDVLSEIS
ncbi:MAG: NAD(P)H-hydrate dehydratase [Anaerolineales bacterium]|nr:NAD(P)H-hydrate dehydratase [Anaerolineales bacterium]